MNAILFFGLSAIIGCSHQQVLTADGDLHLTPLEIDFIDGNITARAPYPHLNIKIRRNGQFVDTALNVQPGTPLEMIIYLDDESRHVYGLLVSFLKVTATSHNNNTQEEIIILNGCSIDPYIFGNFETLDGGDSLSAKFRAFKFPESNYVKFVGTVNVCLSECKGVPCGNGQWGYGRRKRSALRPIPKDKNKVMELDLQTILRVDFPPEYYSRMHQEAIEARLVGKASQPQHLNQTKRQVFEFGVNSLPALTLSVEPMVILLFVALYSSLYLKF